MSSIIIKAITLNIHNLSTYDGYNGADILKFEIFDNGVLSELRDFCINNKIKYKVKIPYTKNTPYELYCIIEIPDDVYGLKRD